MPSRTRGGKITKLGTASAGVSPFTSGPASRGSRQSSISSAAQEKLGQLAQDAGANTRGNNMGPEIHDLTSPSPPAQGHGSIPEDESNSSASGSGVHDTVSLGGSPNMLATHGEPMTGLQQTMSLNAGSLFQLAEQMTGGSSSSTTSTTSSLAQSRTAADIAVGIYGESIRIDSALCKKLAGDAALRMPHQRRADQRLNMERRSNVEALLAHCTGRLSRQSCKNCRKGHGPWKECVVYEGQMCGSCTNCWFNASGSRCTYHEANVQQQQELQQQQQQQQQQSGLPYLNGMQNQNGMYGGGGQASGASMNCQPPSIPSHVPSHMPHVPIMPSAPAPMASVSRPDSQPLPHLAPAQQFPQSPPAPMDGLPNVNNWGLIDPARSLVTQALADVRGYSKRERLMCRVEAAAKELGMRIAELDEYLASPEGAAEQQRAYEQTQTQAQAQLHAQEQVIEPDHQPSDSGLNDDKSHEGAL